MTCTLSPLSFSAARTSTLRQIVDGEHAHIINVLDGSLILTSLRKMESFDNFSCIRPLWSPAHGGFQDQ